MIANSPVVYRLTEFQPLNLPRDDFPDDLGILLYERFADKVQVEFPSHPTGQQWRLTSKGWVGHIPLSEKLHLALEPKVGLHNLFRMLEVAYRLDIKQLPGLAACDSIKDFYDRLAAILSERVMSRGRKGYYRDYLQYTDALPYIREKVDVSSRARAPWKVDIACHYHEHTLDIEENQILAWTLYTIGRSGICTPQTLARIRRAFHELTGYVSLKPFQPKDCERRLYNRLNSDYELLHALCRFFLDDSGPTHKVGDRTMIPFLVEMSRLFEQFVAEWLQKNLDNQWMVKAQEKLPLGPEHGQYFQTDLMLVDRRTGQVETILDTKYKTKVKPDEGDIAQVVAYATRAGCSDAVLIYPTGEIDQIDYTIGQIRVRSLGFDIRSDLDTAGVEFCNQLLGIRSESL
jgi:5-methylcytosine-specific restriction enzyme subunit McrC